MSSFILAVIPIVLLVLLLGVFRISGEVSSSITLAVTFLIAILGFKYSVQAGLMAFLYGALKAVSPILLVILAAIYSYNVLVKTKYMETLKRMFISISPDKGIQVLLIVWGFGGLLEGMAGFGTAVAIPAAILIGMGFSPVFASVVSLLANTVPTAFGAVGIPVIMLGKETGLNVDHLATDVTLQLGVLNILLPFVLLYLTNSAKKQIPKHIFMSIFFGGITFLGQYVSAKYIGVAFPAIVGSIIAIMVIVLYARMQRHTIQNELQASETPIPTHKVKAWAVYGFIFVFIFISSNLGFKDALSNIAVTSFSITISEGVTKTYAIEWLTHTGVLIFLGAFIGGLIQGASVRTLFSVLGHTARKLDKTTLTVISLVGLSTIMDYSGMIPVIAHGLASATGSLYPLFAPTVGCLGTFITGSDTSSNILFGKLQQSVAGQIGADPTWLSAANTTGATGGKMISPQSIIIATSSTGQAGQEGILLKKTLPYAVAYIILGGLLVYFLGH